MSEQNLFVLVSLMEGALVRHWSFRATDEVAVARHLLQDPWEYQDVFWALRLSTRQVEDLRPEELLQAIRDSYFTPHARAVLYLLPVSQPAACAAAEAPHSTAAVSTTAPARTTPPPT